MKAIISVFLFVFVAYVAAQSIAVNTTELCTNYRYEVSWDRGALQSAQYTVDSPNITAAIARYQIPADKPTGSRYNYLLPQSGFIYDATLVNAASNTKVAGPMSFSHDPCQNLPTYGKTLSEQATLVLDHYRTQVLGSYRIYRNPKLDQLAGMLLAANSDNIGAFLPQLNPPDWYSFAAFPMYTDADAGSLIQLLFDTPSSFIAAENNISLADTTVFREIGFAFNASQKTWQVVATNRSSIRCGNGLLDQTEECDDGNRDDYDGCSSNCQIENGWSCPDNVLQSGSVCVTTPSYVPLNSPDQGGNPNNPSGSNNPSGNSPSGSNSPSGGNNPSDGSPSGSNSPSAQQTSGSNKMEATAIIVLLIALLY